MPVNTFVVLLLQACKRKLTGSKRSADFQGWRRILNLLAQPPLHQHSVYRYVYCGHITSQDASGELFFATSSFASARAELFRPIRNAQAVQNYRQFNFLSNRPFKHYYCIATASHSQPVQAGRASRPSKHYYCRAFKHAMQILYQTGRAALLFASPLSLMFRPWLAPTLAFV